MRRIWLSLFILPLLNGCAEKPFAASAPVTYPKIAPQDFAPGLVTDTPADEQKVLLNDPSAPVTTPLCGTALKEAMQVGGVLYAQSLVTPGSCPRNACFDPLTDTFIAADGNRSVCR